MEVAVSWGMAWGGMETSVFPACHAPVGVAGIVAGFTVPKINTRLRHMRRIPVGQSYIARYFPQKIY